MQNEKKTKKQRAKHKGNQEQKLYNRILTVVNNSTSLSSFSINTLLSHFLFFFLSFSPLSVEDFNKIGVSFKNVQVKKHDFVFKKKKRVLENESKCVRVLIDEFLIKKNFCEVFVFCLLLFERDFFLREAFVPYRPIIKMLPIDQGRKGEDKRSSRSKSRSRSEDDWALGLVTPTLTLISSSCFDSVLFLFVRQRKEKKQKKQIIITNTIQHKQKQRVREETERLENQQTVYPLRNISKS